MQEEWKPVKGFKGLYEVSNKGNVRSVARTIIRSDGMKMTYKSRNLKLQNIFGYYAVSLSNAGKVRSRQVHRMVAEAFCLKREGCELVCHKNDVPTDNRSVNLYWGTKTSNTIDSIKNGRQLGSPGAAHPRYSITPAKAARIRKLRKNRWTYAAIGNVIGCSAVTASDVVNKRGRFA